MEMEQRDAERAVQQWRYTVEFYEMLVRKASWKHYSSFLEFVRRVAQSERARRYFAHTSMATLGISTYPDWARFSKVPGLSVWPREDGWFVFELHDPTTGMRWGARVSRGRRDGGAG